MSCPCPVRTGETVMMFYALLSLDSAVPIPFTDVPDNDDTQDPNNVITVIAFVGIETIEPGDLWLC